MSGFDVNEATHRQMDRLLATATRGPQPDRGEQMTMSVKGVSIALSLADVEAVINELELGAPCGICHHNPCSWRLSDAN